MDMVSWSQPSSCGGGEGYWSTGAQDSSSYLHYITFAFILGELYKKTLKMVRGTIYVSIFMISSI